MSRPAGTGPPASRGGGDSARSPALRDDAQFLRFAAAGRVSYAGTAITGVVLPILVYWRTLVTAKPSCRAGSWPSTPSHRRDLPAQAESWAALSSGSDTAENRHQKGHASASLVPGRSACRSAGSLLSARTRGNLLPAD